MPPKGYKKKIAPIGLTPATSTTNAFVMETTPPHLRHLGGDFLIEAGTPVGVDTSKAKNLSPYTILKGDVVHKTAPESAFQFTTIEDKPGVRVSVDARLGGWQPVMCNDFYFSERMQLVFSPAPDGRMTVGGETKDTLILYVRPAERLKADLAANRRWTDDVGKSMEDKMADVGGRLAWAGMTPLMIDETMNGEGGVVSRRETDFVSKGF